MGASVRMRIGIFIVALLCSPLALAQNNGEQISLPFECYAVAGKVGLLSSQPQIYRIAGHREIRQVQVCKARSAANCRAVNVHRFEVVCDGTPVPWTTLAALIASRKGGDASLQDDRLVIRNWRPVLNCADRQPGDSHSGGRKGAKQSACEGEREWDINLGQVRFPAGFAPLDELGALLLPPAPGSKPVEPRSPANSDGDTFPRSLETAAATHAGASKALEADGANKQVPGPVTFGWVASPPAVLLEPKSNQSPRPDAPTEQPPQQPAQLGSLEFPVTPSPPAPASIHRSESSIPAKSVHQVGGAWILTLALVPFLMAICFSLIDSAFAPFVRWLKGISLARSPSPTLARVIEGTEQDARACRNLLGSATAELMSAYKFVGAIPNAGALQSALNRELDAVRVQLGLAPAWKSKAARNMTWNDIKKRLTWSIQEIRRIASIAEAANESINSHPEAAKILSTRLEAYSFLGVHAHADAAAMKKTVEGLRQCWHPDLATNDVDRRHREIRIRQINAAWDLICEKRAEAR
jgi:hypothetical protein